MLSGSSGTIISLDSPFSVKQYNNEAFQKKLYSKTIPMTVTIAFGF